MLQKDYEYSAFLSYSHRYRDWVQVLQENLERCLAAEDDGRPVFLDQVDLGPGRSWVGQLQQGLDRAERLVLVATPEALASPRVADEWESRIDQHRDWQSQGRLQVAMLVDTPLPPFLGKNQYVDFTRHSETQYRKALRELVSGLLGHTDKRRLPELPEGVVVPEASAPGLPAKLRRKLVASLVPVVGRKANRSAIATAFEQKRTALEGHPSDECTASAAIVLGTGADEPAVAAGRILETLVGELGEDEPAWADSLEPLRAEIRKLRGKGGGRGLLEVYLGWVARAHAKLVPYFGENGAEELIDRVYVELDLRAERLAEAREGGEPTLARGTTLEELLALRPEEHAWVSRRWVVRGDPGAGKTTLLRHLAARLAAEDEGALVPVFESLPRLLREREWLLDRIERHLNQAGHRAKGLPAVLEREGREGRLLLLLDGLDEVPREERARAEDLLHELSARWPETPIVASTRPIGYRPLGGGFLELDLQPLDEERRQEFLAKWIGRRRGLEDSGAAHEALEHLRSEPGLWELSGNPLYLTLMALLFEEGEQPQKTRTRLYDQVFELLLKGKHRPEGKEIPARKYVHAALRRLGHDMTRENRDAEPPERLVSRLYQPEMESLCRELERHPPWRRGLEPFLRDVAERTGILGPHDGEEADWRYWHRTFREALAAERLEEVLGGRGGRKKVLAQAREVVETDDLSRWAEPYALLAGRVENADRLVSELVEANRPLALRAVATAQGLGPETLAKVLELSEDWQERARVYLRIPELLGEPGRALALLDRLRRRTSDGNDLYFLDLAVAAVGERWKGSAQEAEALRWRLFDQIPRPPEELFREVETQLDGSVPLWLEIPAGSGWVGSPEEEKGEERERPRHEVRIEAPFALAAVPVTNAQYAAFDPELAIKTWEEVPDEALPLHPRVRITWFAANAFCRWLASAFPWAEGARLPTEEEWEVACRAGSESAYWKGDTEKHLAEVGWYNQNSDSRTHRVGGKPANPWGLYDRPEQPERPRRARRARHPPPKISPRPKRAGDHPRAQTSRSSSGECARRRRS